MGYKYRHRETYKGVSIDIKANSTGELSEKLKKKKSRIDHRFMDENTLFGAFGLRYLETYKLPVVADAT